MDAAYKTLDVRYRYHCLSILSRRLLLSLSSPSLAKYFHAGSPGHTCLCVQATLTLSSAEYIMFDWKPQHGSTIHVVPLDGDATKIKKFSAPPYFTYHYLNGFETDDGKSICFDFANFGTPETLKGLYLHEMRESKRPVDKSPLT